jgi:hypothetical protein
MIDNPVCSNALSSIRFNFDPPSNRIEISELQDRKHDLHNIVTDARITIFNNPLFSNALSSIRSSCESGSKITEIRELHNEKHDVHKTSTDAGITMLVNRQPENIPS